MTVRMYCPYDGGNCSLPEFYGCVGSVCGKFNPNQKMSTTQELIFEARKGIQQYREQQWQLFKIGDRPTIPGFRQGSALDEDFSKIQKLLDEAESQLKQETLPKEIFYQINTISMCITDWVKSEGKTGFGDTNSKLAALDYILKRFAPAAEDSNPRPFSYGAVDDNIEVASEAKPSEGARNFTKPREAVGSILADLESISKELAQHNIKFQYYIGHNNVSPSRPK